jgi:glutathione S-transferase
MPLPSMLQLYHWEPNGASARVLICLQEKGLDFVSRYVDVLALEQHRADFLKLNQTGEVPVLVHEGRAHTQSSAICEYVEETFPDRPLMPRDALGRWEVRIWQKRVDDSIAASVSELAWHQFAPRLDAAGRARREAAVAVVACPERRDAWRAALAGYGPEQLARARSRVLDATRQAESCLAGRVWLASAGYSLADVAMFSYFRYLPALLPEEINEAVTPRIMQWLRRLSARIPVQQALAMGRCADPFQVAAPGPEQIRWG